MAEVLELIGELLFAFIHLKFLDKKTPEFYRFLILVGYVFIVLLIASMFISGYINSPSFVQKAVLFVPIAICLTAIIYIFKMYMDLS